MAAESSRSNESNCKRKLRNKIPKRLHRKNKKNGTNTDDKRTDDLPAHASISKQNMIEESIPSSLNTLSSKSRDSSTAVSMDHTSIHYWKYCTKKALNVLEKQASSRRKFFIDRHQERIETVQCLLYQRQKIHALNEENHSVKTLFANHITKTK